MKYDLEYPDYKYINSQEILEDENYKERVSNKLIDGLRDNLVSKLKESYKHIRED